MKTTLPNFFLPEEVIWPACCASSPLVLSCFKPGTLAVFELHTKNCEVFVISLQLYLHNIFFFKDSVNDLKPDMQTECLTQSQNILYRPIWTTFRGPFLKWFGRWWDEHQFWYSFDTSAAIPLRWPFFTVASCFQHTELCLKLLPLSPQRTPNCQIICWLKKVQMDYFPGSRLLPCSRRNSENSANMLLCRLTSVYTAMQKFDKIHFFFYTIT